MKTITAAAFLAFGLAASGMAAEFKGFIEDEACSTKPAMKGDAECAKKCIQGGDKAVALLQHWNEESASEPGEPWNKALAKWQDWFKEK